ncbi:FkbM family methyltransferase [Roseomonas alkaliterrae]|uniref:FkbM family methyltransferase n=1 Tax=Neoroseomonas alkaliterrae TaxID=1452450 RepID=A0A840Y3R6_9PROT|nr:FkbM family methyltransferase [Neoroseomonas alkaliterrae]MBB5689262.1 FkbM family methyltransferase [Neoroseomonas alkaliterrae]MBR0676216.1 FkbM family methyltransferase [Neoroseomonas alkaliterrae]
MSLVSRAAGGATHASIQMLARALARLSRGERSWLARRIMQDRYAEDARILAGFFEEALSAWKNRQYDVALNGEAALLRRLARFAPAVLFDVGANAGDWCLAVREAMPDAALHAFEIDPDTAALFAERLKDAPGLILNPIGLADVEGEVRIFVRPEENTATTMLDAGAEGRVEKTVKVTTGDAYVAKHGLARIDLLKIDVEGAEPRVLEGFAGCFARGMITMVQFEYGPANLQTRFLLGDFHRFFEERGFVLGKIFPEGVTFGPYMPQDEDFRGPNFLACRSDRQDIIEALRCERLEPL